MVLRLIGLVIALASAVLVCEAAHVLDELVGLPKDRNTAVVQVRALDQKPRTGKEPFVAALGDAIKVDLRIRPEWFRDRIKEKGLPNSHDDDPRFAASPVAGASPTPKKEDKGEEAKKKTSQEAEDEQAAQEQYKIYDTLGGEIDGWLRQACLFLDGRAFPDLTPDSVDFWPEHRATNIPYDLDYYWALTFRLNKTDANREEWLALLRGRGLANRPTVLSVGLNKIYNDRVSLFDTAVAPHAPEPWQRFDLRVASPLWSLVSLGVILLIAGCGLWLAGTTDLLRDPTAPRNAAGRYPYSLARCQTAWWLVLIAASYLFLWVVLGEYNTLSAPVVVLLGISAATGLGAIFISSLSQPVQSQLKKEHRSETDPDRLEALQAEKQTELDVREDEIVETQDKLDAATEPTAQKELRQRLKQASVQAAALRAQIAELRDRVRYYRTRSRLGRLLYELLSEHGVVNFYRFQLLAWTLILGVVFVVTVYNDLAMPKFDSTLLVLMGISNGTYLGFKWPTTQQQQQGAAGATGGGATPVA